jgi:hypothetical protein
MPVFHRLREQFLEHLGEDLLHLGVERIPDELHALGNWTGIYCRWCQRSFPGGVGGPENILTSSAFASSRVIVTTSW